MGLKNKIIEGMCITYRHDYSLLLTEEEATHPFNDGMTAKQRDALRRQTEAVRP